MGSFLYSLNMGHNDFRTQIMTVEDLLHRYSRTFEMNSGLSFRRPGVVQASRIIESVLLGMPQPMFYVDDSNSEWVVIEGGEHMYAYVSFCMKGMELSSLYFKKLQYEGRRFYELSPLAKSNLLNTRIVVNVLNPGLTTHERFGIYMCLKSRADSASLRWCRSIIFKEEYQWIKDLAKDVSQSPRRVVLENTICHMLVGCDYKRFLNENGRIHLDVAANFQMEMVYGQQLVQTIRDDFDKILRAYLAGVSYSIISPIDDVCLVVNYHLYKLDGNLGSIMGRGKIRQKVLPFLRSLKDDSAETFCMVIDSILKSI